MFIINPVPRTELKCLPSGQIDYLVNNAGYAQGGVIEEVAPAQILEQFSTNVWGMVSARLSSHNRQ